MRLNMHGTCIEYESLNVSASMNNFHWHMLENSLRCNMIVNTNKYRVKKLIPKLKLKNMLNQKRKSSQFKESGNSSHEKNHLQVIFTLSHLVSWRKKRNPSGTTFLFTKVFFLISAERRKAKLKIYDSWVKSGSCVGFFRCQYDNCLVYTRLKCS